MVSAALSIKPTLPVGLQCQTSSSSTIVATAVQKSFLVYSQTCYYVIVVSNCLWYKSNFDLIKLEEPRSIFWK